VAIALLILCGASLAPGAEAAESALFPITTYGTPREKSASESLLRLTDMPPGFVVGEEAFCGEPRHPSENQGIYERHEGLPLTPEEEFIKRTGTIFCFAHYDQLYRAPGTGATPLRLATFAFVTPSAAAAAEGLALGPELVEETLFTRGFSSGVAPSVGEGARQFDTVQARAKRRRGLPGVLLLWRQGSKIGGVFAIAPKPGVGVAAAAAYAARQQTYLAAPLPYLAAEGEDIPTFLESPEVKVPIYWLGRTFRPKGKLTTSFVGAFPHDPYERPLAGRELTIEYDNGPSLATWKPKGWAKFVKTAAGRRESSWRCTRSRTIELPHGHAVLFASYAKDMRVCPSRPPGHFSAHVFLPGAVIGIGEYLTHGSQGLGDGAYESWRGLEAIVRNLRRYRG
jgi:hypothetical protein